MNTNFLGFNTDSVSAFYDFAARKGRKPPKPTPPQPTTPSNPPVAPPDNTVNPPHFFDHVKNFFGRAVSVIRENQWAACATFAAVNFGLVKLADKVNELAAEFLEKVLKSPTHQTAARHGLTATIVLAGNYAFSQLIQYPLSSLNLVAITTGTMTIKLLVQYGPDAWKKWQGNKTAAST